jgi:hypothetical protein
MNKLSQFVKFKKIYIGYTSSSEREPSKPEPHLVKAPQICSLLATRSAGKKI